MTLALLTPQAATTKLATPQTLQELDAMMRQRQELKEQLRELPGRRADLAAQISANPGNSEARARLQALDGRIGRLESEIERADDAIASALAKGVGSQGVIATPTPTPPPPGFSTEAPEAPWQHFIRDSVTNGYPITLATLVLLGVAMYWRISRSIKRQFVTLTAMQSSRLDEIQRSVDTMAVEVERVSEGQRFVTKVIGEKSLSS